MLRQLRHLRMPALCLLLGSCGWSQVGELQSPSPTAVLATIGQPYSTDGSGVVHTTVRAGADVILTGTSSYTGEAGAGTPILHWDFQQTNATPDTTVDLVKRTSDSYAFTAPQVTSETVLNFTLIVTDANGRTGTARAQVLVKPVRDANHFLTFLQTADAVPVTAVTTTAIPADPSAAYNAGVGFTITVQKLLDYTDTLYTRHTDVPIGAPVSYSGSWPSQIGNGGADCNDPRNPKIEIPIPQINLDDPFPAGSPLAGQRLSDVMQTADIERDPAGKPEPLAPAGQQVIAPAVVKAQITITAGGGVTPQLCVGPGATTPVASTTVSADDLMQAANQGATAAMFDTNATAHTYYATIDPATTDHPWGTRTNLTEWLTQNHFDPGAPDWGADAHVYYTNNFDLGLGRSMYMKIGPCDGGPVDVSQLRQQSPSPEVLQTLAGLVGKCDVASVVVNYSSIQGAVQNINALVAVAMEYSAYPATTGPRFVKFFVFAPDERSGLMQRITSVDLDHRGQKPVPQNCVVCHGGTPLPANQHTAATYPPAVTNGVPGDVNAAFLPWDLSSLLYSDTDPGFSQKTQDQALKAQYTQARQADSFKLLNWGAYLTMADPTRFKLSRELIEGWYGASSPGGTTPAGLPGSFNGNFVPASWQPGTNGNPAHAASIYTDVFARNCRMCHTAQTGFNPNVTSCLFASHQCAISSYQMMSTSLRNAPGLLSSGVMPFARRTSDRLWSDPVPGNSTVLSAGAELLAALAEDHPDVSIVPPGTPAAVIRPFLDEFPGFLPHGRTDVLSLVPISVATGDLPLDGGLVSNPQWRVCLDAGTGSCTGSPQQVAVLNADQVNRALFQVPAKTGTYLVELDSGTSVVATRTLTVNAHPPAINAASLPDRVEPLGTLALSTSSLIPAGDPVIGGNGPLSRISWWVSGLTGFTTTSPCIASGVCSVDPVSGVPSILLQAAGGATAGSYTLNVRDATGAVSALQRNVTIGTGLSAPAVSGYVIANQATQAVLDAGSSQILDLVGPRQVPAPDSIGLQISCDYLLAGAPNPAATWGSSCNVGTSQPDGTLHIGTLAVTGTGVSYAPPPGLSTVGRRGGASEPGPAVVAYYRLQELAPGGAVVSQSDPASLTLQVRARASFSDVLAMLQHATDEDVKSGGVKCVSCHFGPQAPDAIVSFYSAQLSESQLYCELVGCPGFPALAVPADSTRPMVDLSDVLAIPSSTQRGAPPNSVFFRYPANLGAGPGATVPAFHVGGNRCGISPGPPTVLVAPSAELTATPPMAPLNPGRCDLLPVLQWIEDGAHSF